ncbi:MAG: FAD-binding oxidoreductase, partial [Candidatus Dormibacteraeota bacterium]|nr:FAD-binding oxidoreductase [Candidatus Dormibacteraeota bacterium]
MDSALRTQLEKSLGRGAVSGDVIAPRDTDGVVAAVRLLAITRTRFAISSDAGPAATGVTLTTMNLDDVTVAPASLTLRAGAGAAPAAVVGAAAEHGLAVVGMAPQVRAGHVGALLARGEVPRRSLCGIEAVVPGGELVRFGGGVLKDVVGYDLPALLLGSMGRLAVIVAATFRLEPAAA